MKTEIEWIDILIETPEEGEEVLVVTHNNAMYYMTAYHDFFVPDLDYITGYDVEPDYLSMFSVKYWARIESPIVPSGNRYEDMITGAKKLLLYRDLTRQDVCEIWNVNQGISQRVLSDLVNVGYATRERINGVYVYSHDSQE